MTMIKFACALSFGSLMLLGASGCGKSKALLATEEYEKSACACKDATCVTEASKKYAESAKDMSTASSGEAEAITKATTNAASCATKAAMAGVPGAK
jgi:ABC-type glutathione transport system ATPase component